jgi:hypothetical protein
VPDYNIHMPREGGLDVGDGHHGPIDVNSDIVINQCHSVSTASGTSVTVSATSGLLAGDRVLVMQMQDVFATPGATITVNAAGTAGQWEIVRIQSLGGNILTTETLSGTYRTDGNGATAQACLMPEYTTVNVGPSGRIMAADWDGSTGGIVAFYANDTVTITGSIFATATGFLGGQMPPNNGADSITAEETGLGQGGGKGEGLDGTAWNKAGRGAMANGGGGGNGHNAGGGGGGNAGAGGSGGKQSVGIGGNAHPNTPGRAGGSVLLSLPTTVVLGGGGGTGHQNNSHAGLGGDGGGIVMMNVRELNGAGSIVSNGDDGLISIAAGNGRDTDGAGGGGAGGTVWVRTLGGAFTGAIEANGGNGGDNEERFTLHGTGGGGGGGRILLLGVASGVPSVSSGQPGVNLYLGDDPWGAAAGENGIVANAPAE